MASNASDPFRAVQEEVQRQLADIQSDMARWQKLPAKSLKLESGRQSILSSLSELQVDLQDMQATIDIALKEPTKFALTPSELRARQNFVRDLQAEANDAKDIMMAEHASSSTRRKGKSDRQNLLGGSGGRSSSSYDPEYDGAGGRQGSRTAEAREAARRENQESLDQQSQEQQQIVRTQDVELGVLSQSLGRLGEMGSVINTELKAQGTALDEFSHEVDESRNKMKSLNGGRARASASRRRAPAPPHPPTCPPSPTLDPQPPPTHLPCPSSRADAMQKMLKKKDRGKFCCIIVLSIIFIFLLYAVLT